MSVRPSRAGLTFSRQWPTTLPAGAYWPTTNTVMPRLPPRLVHVARPKPTEVEPAQTSCEKCPHPRFSSPRNVYSLISEYHMFVASSPALTEWSHVYVTSYIIIGYKVVCKLSAVERRVAYLLKWKWIRELLLTIWRHRFGKIVYNSNLIIF